VEDGMKSVKRDKVEFMTRDDLDALGCQDPDCNCGSRVMTLRPGCHPHTGVFATYDGEGTLVMRCAVCDQFVASVLVASEYRADDAPKSPETPDASHRAS
jgi:hypothetical protein